MGLSWFSLARSVLQALDHGCLAGSGGGELQGTSTGEGSRTGLPGQGWEVVLGGGFEIKLCRDFFDKKSSQSLTIPVTNFGKNGDGKMKLMMLTCVDSNSATDLGHKGIQR